MSENQSNITFKKSDGKPITFNFQLENGLPYKPILTPKFKLVQSTTSKEYGIYITLTMEELNTINLININQYKLFNKELWLMFDNSYIVLSEFDDKIIEEIQNNNLIFCFFNEQNEFIEGFRFD